MLKLPRRNFLHLAAGAAALPAMLRVAGAQTYPSRPVRIVGQAAVASSQAASTFVSCSAPQCSH